MMDLDGTFAYSKIISLAGNADFAQVFPNPATASLTFQVKEALLNTTATLHDISGRSLQHILIKKSSQELNIKSLASGSYILKFVDGTSERFVKE